MDTIEKEIKIIEYDDKLETLKKYFPIGYEKTRKDFLNGQEKYCIIQTT